MIIETTEKTVTIVLRSKKIVTIKNILKGKNFEGAYFDAVRENDVEALSKIIFTLAETDGRSAFKNSEEVYDFIDNYKKEKDKTYADIYKEITEAINEEGFFTKKMTAEEIETKTNDIMQSLNMEDIMKNATEKATAAVISKEFQGYKA